MLSQSLHEMVLQRVSLYLENLEMSGKWKKSRNLPQNPGERQGMLLCEIHFGQFEHPNLEDFGGAWSDFLSSQRTLTATSFFQLKSVK